MKHSRSTNQLDTNTTLGDKETERKLLKTYSNPSIKAEAYSAVVIGWLVNRKAPNPLAQTLIDQIVSFLGDNSAKVLACL